MIQSPTTQAAVCRLLAAAWDPHSLPSPESISWPDILRLSSANNVGPMLYSLTRSMEETIPPEVRLIWEQEYYHTIISNTRCLHQLGKVGKALANLGVPLLLLKGTALDQTLYQKIAPRPFGDIDLVVPGESVQVCREGLLELGYVPSQAEHRPGDRLIRTNQEQFLPPTFYQAPVELHWQILDVSYYRHRLPLEWFLQNSDSLVIAGQPFRILNREANLIYLPAHLALHHSFQGLYALYDLALLIMQGQDRIDWQKIISVAQSFELVSVLRATLKRLTDCWPELPIDEPRHLLQAIEPSPSDTRLFRLLTDEARTNALDHYTTLVSLPDFTARARYAWVSTFPQPAYIMELYDVKARWQVPYWYLYRLARGFLRFVFMLPSALRIDR